MTKTTLGTTARQIAAYVERTFPSARAQCSVHGAGRGSVQVFRGGALIADIDTTYSAGRHLLALHRIGQHIRANMET